MKNRTKRNLSLCMELRNVPKMVVMSLSSFFLILLILLVVPESNGYSKGAGSCIGGEPAIGGDHLDTYNDARKVVGANLSKGKVTLSLDGTVIQPQVSTPLQTQKDYSLRLATDYPEGFKGVLFRLEVPSSFTVDTSVALTPVNASALRPADDVCVAPIVGLTHADNSAKGYVEVTLRLDQPASGVMLDVTMVGINDVRASLYGFDQYLFDFAGDSAAIGSGGNTPAKSPAPVAPSTQYPTIDVKDFRTDIIGTPAPVHSKVSSSLNALSKSAGISITKSSVATLLISALCVVTGLLLLY